MTARSASAWAASPANVRRSVPHLRHRTLTLPPGRAGLLRLRLVEHADVAREIVLKSLPTDVEPWLAFVRRKLDPERVAHRLDDRPALGVRLDQLGEGLSCR